MVIIISNISLTFFFDVGLCELNRIVVQMVKFYFFL